MLIVDFHYEHLFTAFFILQFLQLQLVLCVSLPSRLRSKTRIIWMVNNSQIYVPHCYSFPMLSSPPPPTQRSTLNTATQRAHTCTGQPKSLTLSYTLAWCSKSWHSVAIIWLWGGGQGFMVPRTTQLGFQFRTEKVEKVQAGQVYFNKCHLGKIKILD